MRSGVATPALDFITDYFPQLKELLIHFDFDFDFDQIEKTYDHRFNTWKMRFSKDSKAALKLKFFESYISLLRQRGVDVFVQPKAKSDFQFETSSQFSFM